MLLSIEVGGTFTDLVALDDEAGLVTAKVRSTPFDPEQAPLRAIRASGLSLNAGVELRHGSTIATNSVLERKGARVILLTTKGFGDVLFIGRTDKEESFDPGYRPTPPPVSRDDVWEVEERVLPSGSIETAPVLAGLVAELQQALAATDEATCVAISFLHSYANPDNELAVYRAIQGEVPKLPVLVSSKIAPRIREYERTSATVLAAYVAPMVRHYLERLEHAVEDLGVVVPLQIMQSDSGVVPAAVAANDPSGMYLSGPVAGVVGAQVVAEAAGIPDVLTLDMGGTSTDVSVIVGGEMVVTSDGRIDNLPIGSSIVDIVTVGAGGGSIAVIDQGGMLQVGPQSAGAEPGPACYGQGGELATLTDALVVLGIIVAEDFVQGEIQLAPELALKAMTPIAERLNMTPADAAVEVLDVAVANVVRGCRLVSVERGRDPRDMSLMVYGGLGPTVAALVAEQLEIGHILVPPLPGVFSAVGLCMAGYRREYALSILGPVADTIDRARVALEELVRTAHDEYRTFVDAGGDPPRVAYWVEARYEGQGYELRIPVRNFSTVTGLEQDFHRVHNTRYGHAFGHTPVWSVNWGITVTRPGRGLLSMPRSPQSAIPAVRRSIWWNGQMTEAWWSVRESLSAVDVVGPAIIAEHTSTTFVPPGWRAGVDDSGNVILRREA